MATGRQGHRRWRAVLALLFAPLLPILAMPPAVAADLPPPEGSRSSLSCPASVRERDLLLCTLTIERAAADGAPDPADTAWTVNLPPTALVADLHARDDAHTTFDPERRVLQGRAAVPSGGVRAVPFRLIAAPDTDGTRLTVRATIDTRPPIDLVSTTEVEPRRAADEAGRAGGLQVTTAGRWVLGFLLTGPLFIGACAWRAGARPGVLGLAFAAWAAAGFLMVFGAMARHDARLWFDYREAACTVTDTGAHTRTSGQGRHATTLSTPFVALQFDDGGRRRVGVGFDSGSHLRAGGDTWPPKGAQAFGPGATVPCWYDPQDPAQAIVVRGPGGAYLFALLPLGLWLLVAWPLGRALWRGR
ncbi:MAG: DUF3592 domain-containing protein [Ideonella sp.]|nr:DUF3592 domain-containing protein [Ideonella sp.]